MVKAQEWLDRNYSKQERKNLKELNLRNLNLEGDLDLGGFSDKLEKIYISGNPNLGKIKNKPERATPIYKNIQEWLNHQSLNEEILLVNPSQPSELIIDGYPNLKKIGRLQGTANLIKLTVSNCFQLEEIDTSDLKNNWDISMKQLILNNLSSLKWLRCSWNNLTNLEIVACPNLKKIDCSNNKLSEIKLSLDVRERLVELSLYSNNFNQDLSFLKDLVNLESLTLSNNLLKDSLEPLKNLSKLESLDINDTDIDSGLEYLPESVTRFYCSNDRRKNAKCQVIFNFLTNEQGKAETEFGRIKSFVQKIQIIKQKIRTNWINLNFSEQEIASWMNIGLTVNEYNLANYFKLKNLTPQQIKGKLEEFKTMKQSEETINQFIQEANLTKISYERLDNIEYLTQGGFGKIYQAEWEDKNVILKSLDDSQELTPEFLQEIASHELFGDSGKIVKCHGISQNHKSKEYVMVMEYIRGGNLRQYLQKNNSKLDLKKKLIQLSSIAEGLKDIHEKGLTHKDFHSGNILSKGEGVFFEDLICRITDLGLCKPANDTNTENIYGVMPYVAPEVLRNKPYTQASDIYSFGIVAYEVLSGLSPHGNRNHDISLALEICGKERLRPKFQIKIPQLLEDVIKRCWEDNLLQRPTANELSNTLNAWYQELKTKKDTEFTQQVKEAEEVNKNLSEEVKFPKYKVHSGATCHSRFLPTKEISEILFQSQEVGEQVHAKEETGDLESCAIIDVEQEKIVQHAQIIHNPHKSN